MEKKSDEANQIEATADRLTTMVAREFRASGLTPLQFSGAALMASLNIACDNCGAEAGIQLGRNVAEAFARHHLEDVG